MCVIRRDALMNGPGLLAGRTVGYVVDPVRCVKLDRPEDWGRAERIARLGVPAVQINTQGGCHLDAAMIQAVGKVVHEGLKPEDAFQAYRSLKDAIESTS